jgi:D-glycero-alpha-D-manno-heptose-7-phosphate kinase
MECGDSAPPLRRNPRHERTCTRTIPTNPPLLLSLHTPTRPLLSETPVYGKLTPAKSFPPKSNWHDKGSANTYMRITSKAPTRVDLAGGTLDIWPLYLFHPGAVTVNAAITRYASCVIDQHPEGDDRIKLISQDTRLEESFDSFAALVKGKRYRLPLLAEIAKFFQPEGGFTLTTNSEAPAGAGIGGSSAMAVAICAALDRFTAAGKSKADWIHISRDAEAIVIRVPTGTQDHYPPAFGGAAAIELPPGGERRTELRVDLSELEKRLVLCYTGKPRKSAINNWDVFQKHINGNKKVHHNLARISEVAQALRGALEKSQWTEAGRLMREEWTFRKKNLPTISTKTIDKIVDGSRRKGALAAKVCGAGGGGCVVLLIEADAREKVEAAIAEAGGQVLPMKIDRSGVQVNVS